MSAAASPSLPSSQPALPLPVFLLASPPLSSHLCRATVSRAEQLLTSCWRLPRTTRKTQAAAQRWDLRPSAAEAYARHSVHTILAASFGGGGERICATIQAPPCTLCVEAGESGESWPVRSFESNAAAAPPTQ